MPPPRSLRALLMLALVPTFAAAQTPAAPAPDLKFWSACLAEGATPPPAAELPQRLRELDTLLAAPDPVQRDDLGFAVLVKWLYRDRIVPVELRRELLAEWTRSLRHGIDRPGTDDTARRSFAALSLSILAALDNEAPFLDRAEFAALLTAAIEYLRDEQDVRGYDPRLGWLHAIAHTADLLKHLARSRHLDADGQARILTSIGDRLRSLDTPLVHGEDERLARALLSLLAREDFAAKEFRAWLPRAWPRPAAKVDPTELARSHNRRHLLLSLLGLLQIERRALPHADAVRTSLTDLLRVWQG